MTTEDRISLQVENIKCGGCRNTIEGALRKIKGVTDCSIDVETGHISVDGHAERSQVIATLASLGYPESGTDNNLIMKAKSFVSCAVGRVRNHGHE